MLKFSYFLLFVGFVATIIGITMTIATAVKKKSKKPWVITLIAGLAVVILSTIVGVSATNAQEEALEPHLSISTGEGDVSKKGLITSNMGTIKGKAKNLKYVVFESDGTVWSVSKVRKSGSWALTNVYSGGAKYGRVYGSNKKVKETSDYKKPSTPTIKISFTKSVVAQSKSDVDGASDDSDNSSDDGSSSDSSSASSSSQAFNAADYSTAYTYDQLARTPNQYEGKKVAFTGQVAQIVENDDEDNIRVEINGTIDDTVLVGFDPDILNGSHILEGDKITFYGTSKGTTSYKSTLGQKITIPAILAEKVTDAGTAPDDYEN